MVKAFVFKSKTKNGSGTPRQNSFDPGEVNGSGTPRQTSFTLGMVHGQRAGDCWRLSSKSSKPAQ